jgi:hypothetical protein
MSVITESMLRFTQYETTLMIEKSKKLLLIKDL